MDLNILSIEYLEFKGVQKRTWLGGYANNEKIENIIVQWEQDTRNRI